MKKEKNILIDKACELVRETGYNVACIENDDNYDVSHGHIYSRALFLYESACNILIALAGSQTAKAYINSTYKPRTVKERK